MALSTATAHKRPLGPAVPYDFRRPIQLSKENSRVLQLALDNFARSSTTAFTSVLRTVVTVSLERVEQRSYAEYVETLPAETYMVLLDTDPVPGSGVIQMDLESVFLCLDIMLGGPGAEKQPARQLTEIEDGVFKLLIENRLLDGLRNAIGPIVPMSLNINSIEFSPQFALASSNADIMIVATFAVEFRNTQTEITLALPFSGINPFLVKAAKGGSLSRAEQEKRASFAADLKRVLTDVPVDVRVVTRPTTASPSYIRSLQVGDVIALDHPAAAPFDLVADDTLIGHASPGQRGKKLAARIESITSPDDKGENT